MSHSIAEVRVQLQITLTQMQLCVKLEIPNQIYCYLMKTLSLTLLLASMAYSHNLAAGACTIYINSVTNQDNVGVYQCYSDGTCVLMESYFDSEAASTPLQPDEEVIDLGMANTNASGAGQNDKTASTLSNCFDPGTGGGSSGGAPTLPPVVATAPRPERIIVLRPYYFHGGTGNTGGIGNSSTRAARERKKVRVDTYCGIEYDARAVEARRAIVEANNHVVPPSGTIFIGTTRDGYNETWMVGSLFSSAHGVALVNSECPNGGGS